MTTATITQPTPNDLYKAAQRLIKGGQPVFPCLSQDDVRGTKKAKSPYTRNGYQDASTDLAQVKAWWRTRRSAAIGIPTGVVYDVLDVDVKNGSDGRRHLHKLQHNGLLNGCKRVVKSPSGGFHLYFLADPTLPLTNKANRELGLDVRSKGGYVLAPPSYIVVFDDLGEFAYEGVYQDLGEPANSTDEPLYWDLILNALAPINEDTKKPIHLPPMERSNIGGLRQFVLRLQQGERNNGLHWAVCRCIDSGIDPNELLDVALYTGLTEEETHKTINSAISRAGLTVSDLRSETEAMFGNE